MNYEIYFINTIDTDEQGRVKVLFHFEKNQITSCYLRVSNLSSGTGYGTQFIPRVNSEVIVSFINGNPDYPIIIGTLHNGENKNPYNLPSNKTKSFIKTYSIPQYEDKIGFNEILFEDKRGDEQLNLHAQKDMNTLILNDKNLNVKNNSNILIESNKDETIKKDSTQTVGQNKTVNVKENEIKTVDKEKIVTVKENYNVEVHKDLNEIVKRNILEIIEKNLNLKIDGTQITSVQNDVKKRYLENLFQQVGKKFRLDVQNNYHLKANKIKKVVDKFELIAGNGISLKVGGNVLTVNPSGIHMKTPLLDTTSSNSGVRVEDVEALVETHDQQIKLVDSTSGKPFVNQKYKITASTGEVLEGITDENGFTQRIKTQNEATLNIEIINEVK